MRNDLARDCIVVGSGPAGVACVDALLNRGLDVLLVDSAISDDLGRVEDWAKRLSGPKENWNPKTVSEFKHTCFTMRGVRPTKTNMGSDLAYRQNVHFHHIDSNDSRVGVCASFAAGGFSNVWGAVVSEVKNIDFRGWPISGAELAPHFEYALGTLGVQHTGESAERVKLHPQAARILEKMQREVGALNAAGLTFDRASLAVQHVGRDTGNQCQRCGLCHFGCPKGLIFNSKQILNRQLKNPKMEYLPGYTVLGFKESREGVLVEVVGEDGGGRRLIAKKIFLATGPIASAAILAHSLKIEEPVLFTDTPCFILPTFVSFSQKGAASSNSLGLSQFFLDLKSGQVAGPAFRAHLQYYSPSPYFEEYLNRLLKFEVLTTIVKYFVLDRIGLIQGYLDSALSASLRLRPVQFGKQKSQFCFEGQNSTRALSALKEVVRTLQANHRYLGFRPLFGLSGLQSVGGGFHFGASFPMGGRGKMSSDTLGRPMGLHRTHVVDASVLPTIQPGPITQTVMANAHRIGSYA